MNNESDVLNKLTQTLRNNPPKMHAPDDCTREIMQSIAQPHQAGIPLSWLIIRTASSLAALILLGLLLTQFLNDPCSPRIKEHPYSTVFIWSPPVAAEQPATDKQNLPEAYLKHLRNNRIKNERNRQLYEKF